MFFFLQVGYLNYHVSFEFIIWIVIGGFTQGRNHITDRSVANVLLRFVLWSITIWFTQGGKISWLSLLWLIFSVIKVVWRSIWGFTWYTSYHCHFSDMSFSTGGNHISDKLYFYISFTPSNLNRLGRRRGGTTLIPWLANLSQLPFDTAYETFTHFTFSVENALVPEVHWIVIREHTEEESYKSNECFKTKPKGSPEETLDWPLLWGPLSIKGHNQDIVYITCHFPFCETICPLRSELV